MSEARTVQAGQRWRYTGEAGPGGYSLTVDSVSGGVVTATNLVGDYFSLPLDLLTRNFELVEPTGDTAP